MFRYLLATFLVLVFSAVVWAQPNLSPEAAIMTEANETKIRTHVLSPDGRFVALMETSMWFGESGFAYDPKGSRIQIWEVASGRLIAKKHTPANAMPQGSFSRDGSKFLCYGMWRRYSEGEFADGKNHIHLWAIPSGKSLTALQIDETDEIERLVLTPDGKQLLGRVHAPGKFVTLNTWDARTGKLIHTKQRNFSFWTSEGWEVRNKFLLTSHPVWSEGERSRNEMKLWSFPENQLLHTLDLEPTSFSKMAVSTNGRKIAFTVSEPRQVIGGVQLWDVQSKKPIPLAGPIQGPGYNFNSLEFTADNQTLVGCDLSLAPLMIPVCGPADQGQSSFPSKQDGVVNLYLWDVKTGALKRTVKFNHSFPVFRSNLYRISLLPDGKRFIALSGNEKVELRSLRDGALLRTFN